MVYCAKCGAKNEDNAEVCARCGEPLLRPEETSRRSWRGEGLRSMRERRSPSFWGIFFGLLIIVYGAIWLLNQVFPWLTWDGLWAFTLVLFGAAVIIRALTRK